MKKKNEQAGIQVAKNIEVGMMQRFQQLQLWLNILQNMLIFSALAVMTLFSTYLLLIAEISKHTYIKNFTQQFYGWCGKIEAAC